MDTNEPGREPTEPSDAELVYVAEDPIAPGTAWAAASRQCGDLEDELEGWRGHGAIVRLVTPTEAREMMSRWIRRDLSGQRPMPKSWPITLADVLGHELPPAPAPDEVAQLRAEVARLNRTILARDDEYEVVRSEQLELLTKNTTLTARVAELEAENALLRGTVRNQQEFITGKEPTDA